MASFLQKTFLLAFLLLNLTLPITAQGTQFITGTCASDADCASGCCGFNTGKCAGPVVAVERDGGCGFTGGAGEAPVAAAAGPAGPAGGAGNGGAGNRGAGNGGAGNGRAGNGGAGNGRAGNGGAGAGGAGTQFITGACTSDADCASGCCGFNTGKCAGAIVALERDGGCGFGDSSSNGNAAQKLRGGQ